MALLNTSLVGDATRHPGRGHPRRVDGGGRLPLQTDAAEGQEEARHVGPLVDLVLQLVLRAADGEERLVRGPPLAPEGVRAGQLVVLLLREVGQRFGGDLPVVEGVRPRLHHPRRADGDLPQQGSDLLLEGGPAGRQRGGGLGELLAHAVVGEEFDYLQRESLVSFVDLG